MIRSSTLARKNHGINPKLPHPPRDELRVLRAVIKNDDRGVTHLLTASQAVVRSFFGDVDIVRMTLGQAAIGDPNELRVLLELRHDLAPQ